MKRLKSLLSEMPFIGRVTPRGGFTVYNADGSPRFDVEAMTEEEQRKRYHDRLRQEELFKRYGPPKK